MSALAYAQHMYETPDDLPEAPDFEPDAADYAHAMDSIDIEQLCKAMATDLSIAQGRFITTDEVSEALSDAYHHAYFTAADTKAGCAAHVRLSAVLAEAIHRHGKDSSDLIADQLDSGTYPLSH